LCLLKCTEKFAGKCRQRCLQLYARLRPRVYLHLYLQPHLYLNPELFAELNREKFEKLFLESSAVLFE
jgi:hypothetical protein